MYLPLRTPFGRIMKTVQLRGLTPHEFAIGHPEMLRMIKRLKIEGQKTGAHPDPSHSQSSTQYH